MPENFSIFPLLFVLFSGYMDTAHLSGVHWSTVMTLAKAITIKEAKTQELMALATSFVMAVIVLDLVSLLIVGVVRPLLLEW